MIRVMGLLAVVSLWPKVAADGWEAGATCPDVVLDNEFVRYAVGATGLNRSFIDKRTGKDYCDGAPPQPFMVARKEGKAFGATKCRRRDSQIEVAFGPSGIVAVVAVRMEKHYFVLEVQRVSDPNVAELDFVNLGLQIRENIGVVLNIARDDQFAACVLALNLQADSHGRSTRQGRLTATCARQPGLVGAKAAIVGCPAAEIRSVIKEVVQREGLPHSPLGGAWAAETQDARGSYLFAAGPSAQDIDEWIEVARIARATHLHLSYWEQSRGHYAPHPARFPRGLADLKTVVDKIHSAGLKAGMHVLTGCIDERDSYVQPIPDKRLAKDAAFTLAAAVSADAVSIPVVEPPPDLPTESGYWMRGGNELVIDNEIITYSGICRESPCRFFGCVRGARGTEAAPHAAGARVGHLLKRYAMYVPDSQSSLVDEIGQQIAEVYNTCGFDMIYLDGAEAMAARNTDPAEPPFDWIPIYHGLDPVASYQPYWHDVPKMKLAILQRLRRPVLVESACFNHFTWHWRSRVGAWDAVHRAPKRYLDSHCSYIPAYRSELMPAHLGWWGVHGAGEDYPATQPDETEYLGAKCLGYDVAVAVQPGGLAALRRNGRRRELLSLLGQYERLRLAGGVPEAVKAQLRRPGAEFHLEPAGGQWRIRPIRYHQHVAEGRQAETARWTVRNEFGRQRPRIRIEALRTTAGYDSNGAVLLTDFSRPDAFLSPVSLKHHLVPDYGGASPGVIQRLERSAAMVKAGDASGSYSATNSDKTQRGWSRMGLRFPAPLDLRGRQAIGVWVYGDGKGEVLNFQLSAREMQGLVDRYVVVDFQGWRCFELIEAEGDRYYDYTWPYVDRRVIGLPVPYERIGWLNILYTNIPPGQTVTCLLSPIKALPTLIAALSNPALTINGRRVVFPVELHSGEYLELEDPGPVQVRDANGNVLRQVELRGELAELSPGDNQVRFDCEPLDSLAPRVHVTVAAVGRPLN